MNAILQTQCTICNHKLNANAIIDGRSDILRL